MGNLSHLIQILSSPQGLLLKLILSQDMVPGKVNHSILHKAIHFLSLLKAQTSSLPKQKIRARFSHSSDTNIMRLSPHTRGKPLHTWAKAQQLLSNYPPNALLKNPSEGWNIHEGSYRNATRMLELYTHIITVKY